MSRFYSGRRTKNMFDPLSKESFRLSRSKLELFLDCPRCFYLDRRLGVGRPPGYPLTLNVAVDKLLKREFDTHRAKGVAHPLMEAYGVDAVPYANPALDTWRDNFKGVEYHHEPTNFILTGAVDDVWVNPRGELIVVDYKATAKDGDVSIDADWQIAYKRQMEFYQWLLRRNGFTVSDRGYFVYANGATDREAFDKKLEFDVKVIPYDGNDAWVERAVIDARKCLDSDTTPPPSSECDYCAYCRALAEV